MLIFRLLKRHAKNRVHQLDKSSGSEDSGISAIANTTGPKTGGNSIGLPDNTNRLKTNTLTDILAPSSMDSSAKPSPASEGNMARFSSNYNNNSDSGVNSNQRMLNASDSDGVYRVPEPKLNGTRYIIGPGSVGNFYGGGTNLMGPTSFVPNKQQTQQQSYQRRQLHQQQQQQLHKPPPAIISLEHSRPLYC